MGLVKGRETYEVTKVLGRGAFGALAAHSRIMVVSDNTYYRTCIILYIILYIM